MLQADVIQIVLGVPAIFGAGVAFGRKWRKRDMLHEGLAAASKALLLVRLTSTGINKEIFQRGDNIEISYEIESAEDIPLGIWLGASVRDSENKMFNDVTQDKLVPISKGSHRYTRVLTIPVRTTVGMNKLNTNIWFGKPGDSSRSIRLHGMPQKDVRVI